MPADSPPTGHGAARPVRSAPSHRRRWLCVVATIAVVALACTAGAVEWSRSSTPGSAKPVARTFAADNLNGANGAPGDSPSAAASAKARAAKAKAAAAAARPSASSGFSPGSTYFPGSGRVYLGAAGDSQGLSRSTGLTLSDHAYAFFNGPVPQGRMITVKAPGMPWRSVAAAGPGSATYNDIVRWAQTIKARGVTTMFAYHHEPEGANSKTYGTAADYIQAWRHVITIFRAQGVRNVIFTWQMTAWAFRTSPSDPRYAGRWYPGDAYVDSVGADAYNWGPCGEGSGKWEELKTLGDPVLAFARAHGKQAAFPEFASQADVRRAQWVYNALAYLAANRSHITGAFYFYRPPTVRANDDCKWPLSAQTEYLAWAALGGNRAYFLP